MNRARIVPLRPNVAADPAAAFAVALGDLVREAAAEAVRAALGEHAPPEPPSALVDRRELARQLACSDRTIARLESEGLPVVRVGDAPRYELAEVLQWLRGRGDRP
jgi:hypothetical protein